MTPDERMHVRAPGRALSPTPQTHSLGRGMTRRDLTPRPAAGSSSSRPGRRIVDVMPRHDLTSETTPAPVLGAVPPPLTTTAPVARPAVLLTAAEVAELLRIDPYTVRRYVQRGELPAYRVGRELRFDPADVRTYLDGRRSA